MANNPTIPEGVTDEESADAFLSSSFVDEGEPPAPAAVADPPADSPEQTRDEQGRFTSEEPPVVPAQSPEQLKSEPHEAATDESQPGPDAETEVTPDEGLTDEEWDKLEEESLSHDEVLEELSLDDFDPKEYAGELGMPLDRVRFIADEIVVCKKGAKKAKKDAESEDPTKKKKRLKTWRVPQNEFDPDKHDEISDGIYTVEQLDTALQEVLEAAKVPTLFIIDSYDALSDDAEMSRAADDHATYAMQKAKHGSAMFRKQFGAFSPATALIHCPT